MPQANDLSRCLTALDQDSTLITVIEMSQSSWLVDGIVPGVERHPAKKLEPNQSDLLRLLHHWRAEAKRSGRKCWKNGITRTQIIRAKKLRCNCSRNKPRRHRTQRR